MFSKLGSGARHRAVGRERLCPDGGPRNHPGRAYGEEPAATDSGRLRSVVDELPIYVLETTQEIVQPEPGWLFL